MYTYVHTYIQTCMCVFCICKNMCLHVYIYTHIYIYTYVYVCINRYTHRYTYAYTDRERWGVWFSGCGSELGTCTFSDLSFGVQVWALRYKLSTTIRVWGFGPGVLACNPLSSFRYRKHFRVKYNSRKWKVGLHEAIEDLQTYRALYTKLGLEFKVLRKSSVGARPECRVASMGSYTWGFLLVALVMSHVRGLITPPIPLNPIESLEEPLKEPHNPTYNYP